MSAAPRSVAPWPRYYSRVLRGIAAGTIAIACAGCASGITTDTSPSKVVNEVYTNKEIPKTRNLSGVEWQSVVVKRRNGERLEIRVAGLYTAQFEEWHDWSLAYNRTEHISASIIACPFMIALSPLGAVTDGVDKTATNTRDACIGGTHELKPEIRHAKDAPQRTGKIFAQAVRSGFDGPLAIGVDSHPPITVTSQGGVATVAMSELTTRYGEGISRVRISAFGVDVAAPYTASVEKLRDDAKVREQQYFQKQQEIVDSRADVRERREECYRHNQEWADKTDQEVNSARSDSMNNPNHASINGDYINKVNRINSQMQQHCEQIRPENNPYDDY